VYNTSDCKLVLAKAALVSAWWICVLLSAFVVEYIESRANVFEEDRYDPKK
jgi:hypothetical protein